MGKRSARRAGSIFRRVCDGFLLLSFFSGVEIDIKNYVLKSTSIQ